MHILPHSMHDWQKLLRNWHRQLKLSATYGYIWHVIRMASAYLILNTETVQNDDRGVNQFKQFLIVIWKFTQTVTLKVGE